MVGGGNWAVAFGRGNVFDPVTGKLIYSAPPIALGAGLAARPDDAEASQPKTGGLLDRLERSPPSPRGTDSSYGREGDSLSAPYTPNWDQQVGQWAGKKATDLGVSNAWSRSIGDTAETAAGLVTWPHDAGVTVGEGVSHGSPMMAAMGLGQLALGVAPVPGLRSLLALPKPAAAGSVNSMIGSAASRAAMP